jgi:hypothetical protein
MESSAQVSTGKIVTILNGTWTQFTVIDGGFFDARDDGTKTPVGLVITEGEEKNQKSNWPTGGIILRKQSETMIVEVAAFTPQKDISEALQSIPIVVKGGKRDVFNSRPEYFNRTAIGLDSSDNYVGVGVFADNGDAVSAFEFAELLQRLREVGGRSIQDALALDAGPSAHIYIPSIQKHFGYATENYVPNILRFCPKIDSRQ